MFEYAKHEFNNWLTKQSFFNFTPYEKTIINIIIKHFEDIAKVGTQQGARAKLLAQYIHNLNCVTLCDEPKVEAFDQTPLFPIKLTSLTVEQFRGFSTQVVFNFDKQYTFFHGANGSGKTSFCEALEYGVLGTIEEASARHIPLDKYILHAGLKKVKKPILKCLYNDNIERDFLPNLALYRFAFVEKNRIDAFSHIGATSAKAQIDRIAALFGLSEFQGFISGFTNSLDSRYIQLNSTTPNSIVELNNEITFLDNSIKTETNTLTTIKANLVHQLEAIGNPDVKDANSARTYLSDPEIGKISILYKKAEKEKKPYISLTTISELKQHTKQYLISTKLIIDNQSIILQETESVNLLALYNSLVSLQSTWKENECPACHTPLDQVKTNPFEHAKESIQSLKQIEKAKSEIVSNAKKANQCLNNIKEKINDYLLLFSGMNLTTLLSCMVTNEDFAQQTNIVKELNTTIDTMNQILYSDNMSSTIDDYNSKAKANNEKYNAEIKQLQDILNSIDTIDADIRAKEKNISEWNNKLKTSKNALEALIKSSEQEKKVIEFNTNIVTAYNAIVNKLQLYTDSLPAAIAHNLSQKVMEYYNEMNYGDAEFELLSQLTLPITSDDKMIIKMQDGTEQDAMLLLSEGHVRILGLAILLAKAVQEKTPFLIFDDIVNSIDDDHRGGVAKLLMENEDFKDMQMILTCHGEYFVSVLEEKVQNPNNMERYMFLPADTLAERGIVIKYQDPYIPLLTAREKFNNNELKDCAAKCRQAVECITGLLWKKLSPYCKDGFSVKLRKMNSSPDLFNALTALKAFVSKQCQGLTSINNDLDLLTKDSMWRLLNKGTHIDDTIPEFTRPDVSNLLELIEHLSSEIKSMKIKPSNIISK
ncbi:AAA family ATPase [Aristaeella hokkaidonensis]|uniref:AAA family ATPase n=1 Tax=Aristaeella hokkaidonensis TaxID=3046382 RepID=A0AC61N5A7_9FIRM|nr:AAA family ATPase [Aristaeella hokkaidonensis]QUC66108.1 AAA family ATPase [Aristaeella hokkaidonensis]SNT94889.1 AAA domain-containing protein [Aristaeella hokkaidonensis]